MRLRPEVFGFGGDHGVPAAHDSGQCQRLCASATTRSSGSSVRSNRRGLEPLALARAADDDPAFSLSRSKAWVGWPMPAGRSWLHRRRWRLASARAARRRLGDLSRCEGAMVMSRRTRRGEAAAERLGSSILHGEGLSGSLRGWEARSSERREFEVVDGGGLARDAVVVHGVDAVGGDVHLEEVSRSRAEIEDASTAMPRRVRSSASWRSSTVMPGQNSRSHLVRIIHANCSRKRMSPE